MTLTQPHPRVDPADPPEPVAQPVMMTDAYVQIGEGNLSCLGMEVSLEPENKPIEQTTFCGVRDYPGPVKWHFRCKLAQSFSPNATHSTLREALNDYAADGTPVTFRVRAYRNRPISATNPSFEGTMIPQPYTIFGGAAGAGSEVDIDWIMENEPEEVTTPSTAP